MCSYWYDDTEGTEWGMGEDWDAKNKWHFSLSINDASAQSVNHRKYVLLIPSCSQCCTVVVLMLISRKESWNHCVCTQTNNSLFSMWNNYYFCISCMGADDPDVGCDLFPRDELSEGLLKSSIVIIWTMHRKGCWWNVVFMCALCVAASCRPL